MKRHQFHIDFNAMIDCNLVRLSKTDFKKDVSGNTIELKEGMNITVIMEDLDEFGKQDNLIAQGTVEENNSGVFQTCKWNIRIDKNGIRYESEL